MYIRSTFVLTGREKQHELTMSNSTFAAHHRLALQALSFSELAALQLDRVGFVFLLEALGLERVAADQGADGGLDFACEASARAVPAA